jgi:hypothetical protein
MMADNRSASQSRKAVVSGPAHKAFLRSWLKDRAIGFLVQQGEKDAGKKRPFRGAPRGYYLIASSARLCTFYGV